MTTRREFLGRTIAVSASLLTAAAFVRPARGQAAKAIETFKGQAIFDRILGKALGGNWAALPIGECIGRIARELEGTPYVGFTLEVSEDLEVCTVDLTGLDCVTFFESALNFARMLKRGGRTPEDLLREVTFTRYRGGKLTDFTSRLHYTTDWWHDNVLKGVVRDLSPELPGNAEFTQPVGIMSAKPGNYRQLKANPALVPTIARLEAEINARPKRFIPIAALAEAEKHLRTGDLVGMATKAEGIDISHTGLVIVVDGVPCFMDASSMKSKMKVTLEPGPISKDLATPTCTGAIFARPLEPLVR